MTRAVAGAWGRNAFLFLSAVFFGLPMVWLLLAPTKTRVELSSLPSLSFGSFETLWSSWQNVAEYDDGIVFRWLTNSMVYTVSSTVVAVILSIAAGYGLAKFQFAGRTTVLFLTLLTMIIPQAALILPLYLQMSSVGLTNTPWAVILPMCFYPFGVYLVYLFATTSMPDSIIEAARLDGASEFRILISIFTPLAVPAIAMVIFFAFVSGWNQFFLPYIMLSTPELATMQTGLQLMAANTGAVSGANFVESPVEAPELALAAILAVLPVLVIFVFAQKYLVAGQTHAAEKG